MPNIGNTGVFTNVYLRKLEEETTPDVAQNVVMSYNTRDHRVKERGSDTVTASLYLGDGGVLSNISFDQLAKTSLNVPSRLNFSNVDTGFITTSNVGIANSAPNHTMAIGSNVIINDSAIAPADCNVMSINGNLSVTGQTTITGGIQVVGGSQLVYAEVLVVENPLQMFGNNNTGTLGYDLGSLYRRGGYPTTPGVSNVAVVYRTTGSGASKQEEFAIGFTDSHILENDIIPTGETMNIHLYGNVESYHYFGDGRTLSNISLQQITETNNPVTSELGNVTTITTKFANPKTSIAATSNVGIGVLTPDSRLGVYNDEITWTVRIDRADNLNTKIHFKEIKIYDIGGRLMTISASRSSHQAGDPGTLPVTNAHDGNLNTYVRTAGTNGDDCVEFDVVSRVPPGYIRIDNINGLGGGSNSDLTGCAILIRDSRIHATGQGNTNTATFGNVWYNRTITEIFVDKEFVVPPSSYITTEKVWGDTLSNLVTSNIITSTGRMGVSADKGYTITGDPSYDQYSQFHISNEIGTLSARLGVDQSVGPSGSFFIQGSNNYNTENINILLAPKNGNVGIGTLVPGETLDVDGNIFVNGKVKFGATHRQLVDLYNDAYAIGTQTDTQYYRSGAGYAWYKGGTHHANKFNPGTGGSSMMVLTDTTKLGIGTTEPTSTLQVDGDARVKSVHPTLRFDETDNVQNAFIQVNNGTFHLGNAHADGTESNIISINLETSNVGIGTTHSNAAVQIECGPITAGSIVDALKLKRRDASTNSTLNEVRQVMYSNYKNNENAYSVIRSYCHKEPTAGAEQGAIDFIVASGGEPTPELKAMTLVNSNLYAQVGFGVTEPTANVETARDLKIGTFQHFGNDKRQKINLLDGENATFGIGYQTNTQYFRSAGNFAWYRGGVHHNNTLNKGTGGTAQMVLTTAGQLGIGTTQPTSGYNLDVIGNARVQGHIHLDASDANLNSADVIQANRTQTYVSFGEAGTTNDFAYLRQIGGTDAIKLALDFHNDANDAGFVVRDVNSSGAGTDTVTDRFELKRGGDMYMSGKLGVGVQPDTNYQMNVNGSIKVASGSFMEFLGGTGTKLKLFDTGTDAVKLGIGGNNNKDLNYNVPSTYNHVFQINNQEKFRINDSGDFSISGNVYVGTNDSTVGPKSIYFGGTVGDNTFLDTVIENRVFDETTPSTNSKSELLLFKGNDIDDRIRLRAGEIRFDTKTAGQDRNSDTPKMTIINSGWVGIGITQPQDQLHITGNLRIDALQMKYNATDGLVMDLSGPTNKLLTDGYACTGGTNKLFTTGLTATQATVNGQTIITGDVGIGTNALFPGRVLHANGDIRVEGNIRQKPFVVSLGEGAGATSQSAYGIGIGYRAAYIGQNNATIAMGSNAGYDGQAEGAVAMGFHAGESGQGMNSVALGFYAGANNQHPSTIAINAGVTPLQTARPNATYIKPLSARTQASNVMGYAADGELIDCTTVSFNSGGKLIATQGIEADKFYGDGGFLSNVGTNFTNTISFLNPSIGFKSDSPAHGISNLTPTHTLDVGSNLFIQDTGSNVLSVSGNILAEKITLGNVAISATYTLQQITNTGNTTSKTIQFTNTGNSLVTDGKVGIKTASPTFDLEVTGTAAKTGGGSWSSTSDRRLKENIQDANIDMCYDTVKSIPLRRFRWRDDLEGFSEYQKDKNVLGWIAQEVEEYMPKSINTIEEKYGIDDVKFLNNDQLYASMYGALQKAISKIESLEDELAKIKNSI
tara:strand:+ start:2305 stop:7512 length:5208 start_codon:yes stop_codon:yes gene_type:complete